MSIPYPKWLVCACLALSAQAFAQTAAPSTPAPTADTESRGDAVLRLIIDRGLAPVEAAAQGVRTVRDAAGDLVISAMNFLGLNYRRGGTSVEEGFDCSGFVRYVFQNSIGLVLPRSADEQARSAGVVPIEPSELKPGDLVFFNTLRRAFSHVGIYIGEGKFIHSPRSGSAVRIEDMHLPYWSSRFNGARRVEAIQGPAEPVAAAPTPAARTGR